MIEPTLALGVRAARWLFLCSLIFLTGTLAFLWMIRGRQIRELHVWRKKCLHSAHALAAIASFAACAAAILQALQIADAPFDEGRRWLRALLSTRTGHVWIVRAGLLALVFVLLLLRRLTARGEDVNSDPFLAVGALLATAALAIGGFSGHALAFEPAWPAMLAQAVHLTAVGLWLGALPALVFMLRAADRGASARASTTAAFQQFSQRALFLMALIVASGVPLADLQVERIPALIGTRYGVTLLWKLLLVGAVLAAAAHLRFALLPRFASGASGSSPLARWIALECVLALAVVWLAAELSGTIPARHDTIAWPFDFRYSIDATWPDAKVRERIYLGMVVGALGAAAAWIGWRQGQRVRHWLPLAILLAIAALATSLPPLETDAYPDTYRKTTTPYQAISIANGAQLFAAHCVSCHGSAGHGDGPAGKSLPLRPADLTEAHTALHTAGDLFWWLTHGKPPGVMPGFARMLSEDERWDVINFLRALSSGYQARIIGERMVPKRPWLAAPDFSFTTASGASGTLKDFRDDRVVLLVIGSGSALRARVAELAAQQAALHAARARVLLVSRDAIDPPAALAASVVTEGNAEIAATYALLRRTLMNPDKLDRVAAEHIEFLIDRFGYVRARWVPGENARGWRDFALLKQQVGALVQEPRVLPPPEDHVH